MRNRTSDLRILRSDALPLSYRDPMVSKAHYEVHTPCILLGSVMFFFFVPCSWKDKKYLFSISLPSSNAPSFLIYTQTWHYRHRWSSKYAGRVLYMNFVNLGLAHHRVSVAQWKSIWARNSKVWGSIPHGNSQFFSLSHIHDKVKNIFPQCVML